MSQTIINDVRRGMYVDSVALMRLSQQLAQRAGVREAALMMGTPANIEIMASAGLLTEAGREAMGGDLIIGVRADNSAAAGDALAEAIELLGKTGSAGRTQTVWRPKSLRAAVDAMPDANLALISVPGDFAISEARKAVRRGLHAMIFSDNVAIEEEAELKREARELGCLVMGPDCGTAILNGTALAFANQVRQDNIGIVGASGTGIQEVSCLIDRLGGGVSHAIGVGGRDLSNEVGGISTLMAIDMLESDTQTERLIVISKPPPARVAIEILERVGHCRKPATICFLGADALSVPANAVQVTTLGQAARHAMGCSLDDTALAPHGTIAVPPGRGIVRGLFSGGTLCAEAQVVFKAAGEALCSNAPIGGVGNIGGLSGVHTLLDLGGDEYTKGRPHPMIEPAVRDQQLLEALASDDTGIILLDVVIGYGSHDDPAGHLVATLASSPAVSGPGPAIIASVTGTDADPQNRSAQVAKLDAAGVHVAPANAEAAAWALAAVQATR